jgi:hypothetical protein
MGPRLRGDDVVVGTGWLRARFDNPSQIERAGVRPLLDLIIKWPAAVAAPARVGPLPAE